jgi:hypothetical protein
MVRHRPPPVPSQRKPMTLKELRQRDQPQLVIADMSYLRSFFQNSDFFRWALTQGNPGNFRTCRSYVQPTRGIATGSCAGKIHLTS